MGYKKECFAIFAGGGVRGTAYVGALKALNKLGISLTGYACSSVGAIIASLLAVGYTPEELHELLINVKYQNFHDLHIPMGKDYGIFKGDEVYYWLKENIEKKFYAKEEICKTQPVTFRDLGKNLIVIATDISNATFKEYSKEKTPDVEIAHAVRVSSTIPFFFKPVWEKDICLVDGDYINNFPLWKETSEVIAQTSSQIIEFRLEGGEKPKKINSLMDYFSATLEMSYDVATGLLEEKYGKNDQFDVIRINTGNTRIIEFNLSNKEKEILMNKGYDAVRRYFGHTHQKKRRKINEIYDEIIYHLKGMRKLVVRKGAKEIIASLSELRIYFAENKDYIRKGIYNHFLQLQDSFLDSYVKVKFVGLNIMLDRNSLLKQIDALIEEIEDYIV